MNKEELIKYLEQVQMPNIELKGRKRALRRGLLDAASSRQPVKSNLWNRSISNMFSIKMVPVGVVAIVVAVVLLGSFNSGVRPTANHAQAKEIVQQTITKIAELSYEERWRLNNSLSSDVEKLLQEAYNAPDLKYEEIANNNLEIGRSAKTISYTDSLGRSIVVLINDYNVPQWITIDGYLTTDSNSVTSQVGWKVFDSPELGVTFQYPDSYVDIGISINKGQAGKIVVGLMSKEMCTQPPCVRNGIHFGAASPDYISTKGPIGIENQGFTKKDGKYYLIGLSGQEQEIVHDVKEIQAKNSVGIVISGTDEPSPGAMTPNKRLAIFNLASSQFKAVSFVVYLDNEISELEFETILKTVELR